MRANGRSRKWNLFLLTHKFSRDGGCWDELAVDQYLVKVVNSVQCSCLICKGLISHGRSPFDWSRGTIRREEGFLFFKKTTHDVAAECLPTRSSLCSIAR